MAKVTVTVCDVCHEPNKPTVKWRLGYDGRTKTFDLCNAHAAPLDKLFQSKEGASGRYRRFEEQVATIEEIEARKKSKGKAAKPS